MTKTKGNHKKDLTIITTHINADFDALASMLAAQKLYPDSMAVFPGSQEKNLRNFFIKSMVYLFNMADIKDIDLDNVKKLVLVDTRQASRIGKLSAILDRPDVDIHIYDHHPPMSNDIKGHYEIHCATGATVTILTEILKEKEIEISPDEATILCLGIYEDTGSFTFPSTTEKDFTAAAFLLSKGANLNVVSNLISREISPEQVGLLNDMIQASTRYNIDNIEIVITSVSTDNYVSDFAFLVHKMVKMENLDAIFAIARMGDKMYIVARSRIPEVDVGAIVTHLGGGGHTFAAAATIKGKTLVQIENELLEILYSKIKSRSRAKDLMSSPAITADENVSCKNAGNLLTRYNINALLVTQKNNGKENLQGFITRQIIEKAMYHGLDHIPIKEYMTTEMASVESDSELAEIQEKIIENKQRILPVVEKDIILGVITRTDLLNILVRQSRHTGSNSPDLLKEHLHARTRNILKFMKERLTPRIIDILKSIGEKAEEIGYGAYVVGGFVRDLFLYRNNEDIDIVIEGDGIEFAKKYAKIVGARIHSHAKFGTAVIIFPDGFKIDVASARMEYYKFPAALPTIEMSSIKLDLYRRDFTINTLSIQLNPDRFGLLIDFFSAQKDLKEKIIRVLHNLSFVEDPTRVFRAIRFEQRFGFSIGKLTSGLIENAVKMGFFQRLSGRRVFTELRLILEEENPLPAISRMNEYHLLHVIHPSIILNNDLISLFNSSKKVLSWHDLLFLEEPYMKWAVYFLALLRSRDKETVSEICKRFEIAPRHRSIFCKERFEADRFISLMERNLPVKNSTIYRGISVFKIELILYMMAATKNEALKRSISNYFTQLRHIKTSIKGKDLKKLGLEPGPIYREILGAVLDGKLNGRIKTRSEELAFVKDYVQ
ncbi:MAG: CBS domain-containing protein [Desulfobacteraceae bacterium]|nr:CBS domain-containing protein [Desulfobacteraceae bacterium]MDH3573657.1 CBS domain-containing protein [Desulfobacteraceae bacterium]MDH3721137.1 CBS domain-containing protein [Desulfobacteraceae bacterium]MDH3836220.1 CBS domain-containing protein [Desulfobacteraceae bacterium]MDH3873774.1 CBS domain-containing protein [Desulfobacteraceae bacterium]